MFASPAADVIKGKKVKYGRVAAKTSWGLSSILDQRFFSFSLSVRALVRPPAGILWRYRFRREMARWRSVMRTLTVFVFRVVAVVTQDLKPRGKALAG